MKGGFFFTSSEDIARDVYAWRGNDEVIEAYLKIERPLTLDGYFKATGKDPDVEMHDGRHDPTNYFDDNNEKIVAFAHANGHDGIVFKDETGDENANDLYIVFDVKQIKSATNNNGTYLENGTLTDSVGTNPIRRNQHHRKK